MPRFRYYEKLENLISFYGHMDVRNKTVLDIGADWGSTPDYFLRRGASKIIAIDGSHDYIRKMQEHFHDDDRVIPILLFIRDSKQIQNIIDEYKPDIAKVDCEGCELHLSSVKNIGLIPDWTVEVHSNKIYASMVEHFANNQFYVYRDHYLGKHRYVGPDDLRIVQWKKNHELDN